MSSLTLEKIATLTLILLSATKVGAGTPHCRAMPIRYTPVAPASPVVHKSVQKPVSYELRRPEVTSGSTLTLFAPFLQAQPGLVTLNLNGTSSYCAMIEWTGESATIQLPRLGLVGPQNAELQILLPNGRIMKTFHVVFISQPDIVVHANTIPQPNPPALGAQRPTYATPIADAITLQ